ncbi:MAG: cation diffusion facilitator family transporter [Deltaproteobacteria bacterium]|jgi:cation diffusion facilitator family transporter|nr:cation diffusion facilitator family transporter [Deltaproteobacteria bacterium]
MGNPTDLDMSAKKRAVAVLSVISNSTLIAIKLVAGFFTGSVAIISEAIHSFLDLMAAMMAWGAVRVSENPPDYDHPFGHGKTENFSALFEAILIVVGGGLILKEAIAGVIKGQPLPDLKIGLVVMLLSTVVNYFISRRLFQVAKASDSEALTADAWHLRTDVYSSLGVFLALGFIEVGRLIAPELDLSFVDSLVAGLVAVLIVKTGLILGWDAAQGLGDKTLPDEEIQLIVKSVQNLYPAIQGFRRLRTRRSGPYRHILVDLLVDEGQTVGRAHELGVQFALEVQAHFSKTDVTFHLEPTKPYLVINDDLRA